jgi:hypothetical protein
MMSVPIEKPPTIQQLATDQKRLALAKIERVKKMLRKNCEERKI